MRAGNKATVRKAGHIGPNMTPMVDVVMCILIFFMLGSVFLSPEMVLASHTPISDTGVSTVPQNAPMPAVRLTLQLVRRGDVTWFVAPDGTMLPMDRAGDVAQEKIPAYLAGKRASVSETTEVIISPTQHVPYQDVITLYDQCGHAKFAHVAFAPAQRGE